MENDFNGDAFFGDDSLQQITEIDQLESAAVGIVDPSAGALPVNGDVLRRTLSLHQNGCSNRLSWSRQGHIASISKDGTCIDLQYLIFDRRSRSWILSAKRTEHVGLGQLASLVWSPMATDLAVVDVTGRLSILRPVGTTANRLSEVRAGSGDRVEPFSQAIGVHWLSQDRAERPRQVVQHTSKDEETGKWVHRLVKATPLAPYYQRAVIVITQNANLAMIYERPDGKFGRVSTMLPVSTEGVYTHAACAPSTSGKLIVALHAIGGTISTYSVSIDFSPVKQDEQPSLAAEVAATHLPWLNDTSLNGQSYDTDSQYLTHLGIMPTSEVDKAVQLPSTVYGIFANVNDDMGSVDGRFLLTSTIRRWTLSPVEQASQPKFTQLPVKTKQIEPSTTSLNMAVEALPDKTEQAIINAGLLENGQGLHVTMFDGRTDFLSPEDLSSLTFPSADNSISSLAQTGFAFPLLVSPSILTISPNLCCSALLSPTHTIDLSIAQGPPLDQTSPIDVNNPAADAATAVVVLAFARSCWNNSNIDDLIILVMHSLPSSMADPIIISLYQTLFRETEFIHEKDQRSQLEKVVQKPILTKVFSFHYGVAFLSAKDPNTNIVNTKTPMPLSSQWVWISSNLRLVAQLLYVSIREVQQPGTSPSPELIDMVCGNIKWTLDLIRYMVATVIETTERAYAPEFFTPFRNPEQDSTDGSQSLVSLLLNCHWSRQFFIAIVRAMRVLCKLPEPRSKAAIQIIATIMKYSSGKGVGLMAVDALLDPRWSGRADNEMGNDVQKISSAQIRMMATGMVEGGYLETVKRIASNLFNQGGTLREEGQVGRLKLWQSKCELNWILLDDGWEGEGVGDANRVRKIYDVHKKKVITKGVKESKGAAGGGSDAGEEMIKRCARCGRHNEDVNGLGKEFPRHVAGLMMRCVCDGPWIVEPWAKALES